MNILNIYSSAFIKLSMYSLFLHRWSILKPYMFLFESLRVSQGHTLPLEKLCLTPLIIITDNNRFAHLQHRLFRSINLTDLRSANLRLLLLYKGQAGTFNTNVYGGVRAPFNQNRGQSSHGQRDQRYRSRLVAYR